MDCSFHSQRDLFGLFDLFLKTMKLSPIITQHMAREKNIK